MAEDTVRTEKGNGDDQNRGTEESKRLLNRRDALKMGAAAAAVGLSSVGTIAGSAAAASERYGISFNRVVNAVDDLGLDPNGNEPIDSAINRAIDRGDTLIEFPPGTYYWKDTIAESGVNNWGIRGLGDHPTDVKFVSDEGASQFLLKVNGGRGILVENFAIDYGFDRQGSLGMLLKANDNMRVQDIHFVGFNPTQGNGAVDNLSPQALDSDGRVVVDGLVRTGPTDITSHGHLDGDANEGCIWLGSKHVGELVIRNSHIENTGTNAIYARAAQGAVKIQDSLFVNNNQTSLRIGGDGCHVKGCRFVVDTDNATDENGGEFINPHAITWETGRRGDKGGYIEDCDFIYKSAPSKTTAAVWVDGSAGEMAIRNSRFQMDVDGIAAVRIDNPRDPRLGTTGERPWGVTLDGVSVTGSSSGSAPAIRIDNRNGSTIRNSCLQLTGNRDGIYLRNSDNSVIENTNINVTGQATIFDGSSVSTSGITHSDSCPVPDDSFTVGDGTTTSPSTDTYGSSSHPNTLTVTGKGTKTNYEFSATGGLEGQSDVESWDSVDSGNVSAWITNDGDTDTYAFSKALGPVNILEGDADISVNGTVVDPATLVADAACDHTLQIVPDGTSTNYHLEVSGGVMDHPGLGTSLTKYDAIDGGVIDGWVTNDIDAVQFSGEVTAFSFTEGGATLYLDGEQVDPATLVSSTSDGSTSDGSTDDTTNDSTTDSAYDYALEIVPDGTSTNYLLEVSGEIADHPDLGTPLTQYDSLNGNVLDGWVTNDSDGVQFSGEVTAFSFVEGGATLYLDGEQVDPSTLVSKTSNDGTSDGSTDDSTSDGSTDTTGLPNVITMDGSETKRVTGYEITVTGELEKDTANSVSASSWDDLTDEVDGSTVVGVVDEGIDRFRFSGDIEMLNVNGKASVSFEDNDG
ncbi:DUF1565 domain-containing protein [Halopelagius longus]|uniref:Right handed beta helix region n=1 Tax=Halopelagius longus TaxID=1236180 RepID=A0A1H1GMH2_9EURY|nr:DUF1565 domain-containing protein [Halopelagius longus]RDI69652.1 hypothetical protein DWB78_17935 [Halopelagius longus]SDR14424.1 hypothetical protein SAMN05216278_3771 [Halopelagius longus]